MENIIFKLKPFNREEFDSSCKKINFKDGSIFLLLFRESKVKFCVMSDEELSMLIEATFCLVADQSKIYHDGEIVYKQHPLEVSFYYKDKQLIEYPTLFISNNLVLKVEYSKINDESKIFNYWWIFKPKFAEPLLEIKDMFGIKDDGKFELYVQ
jgi:hypothetical protein